MGSRGAPQGIKSGSEPALASLAGQVVDARTGAPLEHVRVAVEGGGTALTDREGRFRIEGLAPGTHRLQASVVGYAVFRGEVRAGEAAPLIIRLSEGTSAYSETVTVGADVFRGPPDPVPSASIIGSAELLNLRGVLADDPLRAVQVLPGVATGDDLRSEFTVRGSDFRHITFTVDGFATPYLLHAVRGVEDRGPTGSVAMINSDVLEDVTLLNGGYPQYFTGHTGAEVDFRLREGSRERRIFRVAVSGTSASAVAEGPLGARRGSWLVSARQSYLDAIVHRLTERAVSFGFSDAQAKLAYDVSPRHHLDLTALTGRSRFANDPDQREIDDIHVGRNASVVGVAGWRVTTARAVLWQRLLAADNRFRNENTSGVELDDGRDRQLAYRADLTVEAAPHVGLSAGAQAERRDNRRVRRRLAANRVSLLQLDDYSGDGLMTGGFVSARWTPSPSFTLAPGVRADRWGLTAQTSASPWLQSEWRASRTLRLRASAGRYVQFADFENVLGISAGPGLRPERALQFDAGIEQRLADDLRVSVTLYDREERGMLRRPGSETRVSGTRVVRGAADARYDNRLDGFARGVELSLQRSAPGRGISGWLSYAFAKNRYRDTVSGESFWGDSDQRHTVNAYAMYRHSDRASFVAKLRVGSNFPITGYYAEQDGRYVVSDRRNTARLPAYARLDLRANRTFTWSRHRLTLFAEVINVMNRDNVRFDPPGVNTATRATGRPFDSMLPIVPSVGVLIEF
ncbi:MAG TPA: TonB-dependent receptor [Vicinamibacterales bacterium]|nr:TonB-dependent receptor [Vicinamibacterales bacterium]